MRHIIDIIDEYLPFGAQEGYLTAAYIASQKPSRQCSCRIEPHRNLHCMPGSGQSKGSSLHLKTFSNMHQLTPSLCLTEYESEREAETGRIKRRMVEKKGVKKEYTKSLDEDPLWSCDTESILSVGSQDGAPLPYIAANHRIGMCHQPIGVEWVRSTRK